MNGKSNAAPVMEAPRRRRDDCGEAVISLNSYFTTRKRRLQGNHVMTADVFSEIKQRVPTIDAARYYGFSPNRAGFICCPLHREKTPSLKLYPGTGGWHCFGCGKGGSVIDFVAQVFGLDMMQAVRKLNADFALALPLDRPPSREELAHVRYRQHISETERWYLQWRDRMLRDLNAACRVGWLALKRNSSSWTEAEVLAVKWHDALESWAEALDGEDMETQMHIFMDREVAGLCSKILKNTPQRSKAD